MHNGSSKEEDSSEEEARAQDRRGQEVDGEEDRHRPSQNRSQEITLHGAGASGSRANLRADGKAMASNIGALPET